MDQELVQVDVRWPTLFSSPKGLVEILSISILGDFQQNGEVDMPIP
jgi:hypothetical protein